MARYTDRWGLSILGPGDALSGEGYKAVDADRRLIDRLLEYATELHHHSGIAGTDRTPTIGPDLTRQSTGGVMPAGARYYYRYTVIDEDHNESAPSPVQPIDMPAAIAVPGAPAPAVITGSGALLPGNYSYVLSAYKGSPGLETKAANSSVITVPGSAMNPSVSLLLPDVPLGADGFNVYRKSPSGMHYLYLDTITAPTSGQTWVDDGSTEGDCDRSLPAVNRTSNVSAVLVAFPGATPSIPDGWAWRIYRTDRPNDWSHSYLADVTPAGVPASTPYSYLDVGSTTQVGGPPDVAQVINAPSKIDFTDANEITGTLPPGLATVPHVVTFSQAGPVTETAGSFIWVCDFDQADILSVRAYLGIDSTPAATPVVVDVNRFQGATPTWASIFDDGPGRPRVEVGATVGVAVAPIHRHLVAGDALTVDIDQSGGGATPTDVDLTINVLLYTRDGSTTESYDWEA